MIYILNPQTPDELVTMIMDEKTNDNKKAIYVKSIKNVAVIEFLAPLIPHDHNSAIFEGTSIEIIQKIVVSLLELNRPTFDFSMISRDQEVIKGFKEIFIILNEKYEGKFTANIFDSISTLAKHLTNTKVFPAKAPVIDINRARPHDSRANGYPQVLDPTKKIEATGTMVNPLAAWPHHPNSPDRDDHTNDENSQKAAFANRYLPYTETGNVAALRKEAGVDGIALEAPLENALPRSSGNAANGEPFVAIPSPVDISVGPSRARKNILPQFDAIARAKAVEYGYPADNTSVNELDDDALMALAIEASLEDQQVAKAEESKIQVPPPPAKEPPPIPAPPSLKPQASEPISLPSWSERIKRPLNGSDDCKGRYDWSELLGALKSTRLKRILAGKQDGQESLTTKDEEASFNQLYPSITNRP